jgi:hypothetical protein
MGTEKKHASDHHSEYLSRTVAALTPEGHQRVDVILDDLAELVPDHAWLVRFAKAREAEADSGRTDISAEPEPTRMLTTKELDGLVVGFRTIRDQEPLDDVGDWANAVLALLKDEGNPDSRRR